jgi:hypothetical protein
MQTAVLKESLRFSNGVVQPMTRVVPAAGAYISDEFIPGGVSLFIVVSHVLRVSSRARPSLG